LRLGVTRDDNQLTTLRERALSKGIEVIALPITVSRPLDFTWPARLQPDAVDWVFFTSAHGVTSFFERLPNLGIGLSHATRFAVIGRKTAQALESYGVNSSFEPSESYGRALFEEFAQDEAKSGERVLYARAQDVNYDPSGLFRELRVDYVPIVCYRTVPRMVSRKLVDQFSDDDYILFTAPSTISAYHQQFGKPSATPIAIGRSTASAMSEHDWSGFVTMRKAEIENVMEYLPWN